MELIEKQDAIEALKAIRHGLWEIDIPHPGNCPEYKISAMIGNVDGWIKRLTDMPSAESNAPVGTWEEKEIMSLEDSKAIEQWQSAKCSVCGHYHTIPYLYSFHESNFCPHCGARNGGKT